MNGKTFDREKVQLNLAKIKKEGEEFEVVIDPDHAIDYKEGKEIDLREVLKSEEIFFDAKKGMRASEERMKEIFGTEDQLQIAEKIIKEGEIQLTSEHRQKLVEEKKRKIITHIQKNAVDPNTGLPHPITRIENAIEEAKIKIDGFKTAKDQLQEIIKELRPIIPLSFDIKTIELKIPSEHTGKTNSVIRGIAKVIEENWNNDGSWTVKIEVAAGIQQELFDKLNEIVHGNLESKIIN